MLFKALAGDVAIFSMLIVLIHIFIIKYSGLKAAGNLRRQLIAGSCLGAIACVGIAMNSILFHGLSDGKLIIICAAGIFYGWIAASAAALLPFLAMLIFIPDYMDPFRYLLLSLAAIPLSSFSARFILRGERSRTIAALFVFSILMAALSVILDTVGSGSSHLIDAMGYGTLPLGLIVAVFMCGIGWLFLFEIDNQKRATLLRRSNDELASLNLQLSAAEGQLRAQYEDLLASRGIIERSELKYRMLFETGSEGLWTYDPATGETFFSDKLCEICGFDKTMKQLFMFDSKSYVREDYREKVANAFILLMSGTINKLTVDYPSRYRDGTYRWVRLKAISAKDDAGKPIWFVGSIEDIHNKRMQEEKLYREAYFDPMTELPNRRFLLDDLEKSIAECREGSKFAVIQCDLDNFKLINDTFGHAFGDKVIVEIGKRIKALESDRLIVTRSSGDEFIIRVRDISDEEIASISDRMRDFMSGTISLDGNELHITGSAGIAIYPEDGGSVEVLMKNVDAAMCYAKSIGKNNLAFYHFEMSINNAERMRIEQGLRMALARNEFQLHYQPQFTVSDKEIIGFEALIRWNSRMLGFVTPDRFIPIAEETGMIIAIGDWVFRTACLFSRKINRDPDRPLVVSVNISIVQLLQEGFARNIRSIIEETGVAPEHLAIEITESKIMEALDSNLQKLEELRSMGLQIFLDDFGTGYSSLSYLMGIPANKLKIDKSFISYIETEIAHQKITRSIINMAGDLGMAAVAEGVETEEQLQLLKDMRCAFVQGYLLGKPVPETEAMAFLDRQAH